MKNKEIVAHAVRRPVIPAFPAAIPCPATAPRDLATEFNRLVRHSRPMLTLKDLEEAFGVSRTQVRYWVDQGLVVAGDTGTGNVRRHWRVTRQSAQEFYARRFGPGVINE